MRRFHSVATIALAAMTASCSDAAAPPRVILFIGDGAGTSYWSAAALAANNLAVKQFPVAGLVETRSADNKVTDSAAAATAYASGIRTYKRAIGVDSDTNNVATIVEVAQLRGMATGLVVTSSIAHATPAAFASHVPDRDMYWEIARQMAEAGVDVLLGGGRRYFDSAHRPDELDLLTALAVDHTVVSTEGEFHDLDPTRVSKLVGLFAEGHMPDASSRTPSLPDMTATALEILDRDPDGFFLMVEGSHPDWLGGDNAALDSVTTEMLDLDRAIGVALEYQRNNPATLIVATADHETGGLAIQSGDGESASELVARYTTGSHTASMVPLFASGPGAERFGGIKENWMIGRLLLEAVAQ